MCTNRLSIISSEGQPTFTQFQSSKLDRTISLTFEGPQFRGNYLKTVPLGMRNMDTYLPNFCRAWQTNCLFSANIIKQPLKINRATRHDTIVGHLYFLVTRERVG